MYIGLDISKKRIGISIGVINENNEPIVTPYKIFENNHLVINIIKDLKEKFKPKDFVIGLPSPVYENYKFIKTFVHKYREHLKPFTFINEDYSSFLVNSNNFETKDDLAAVIILERYFKLQNRK